MSRIEKTILFVTLLLVLGFRLLHLTGPLDESSWRQSWCAYQARELSRESPPEILHVKINYKGTNDVSVWNFPAYEGLVAMTYKVAGGESLPLARLITLAFYLGAAYFLYRILVLFLGARIAIYSAVVYLCLPAGIFYSRAVHYDASVLFFANAFLYFSLRFDETRKPAAYGTAVLMASLAFLVKSPYCFYMALPLGAWIFFGREPRKFTRLVLAASLFLVPFLLGWGFHLYRLHLEGHLTSTLLYPDPYTADYARKWYFGTLAQRLDPARWILLARNTFWVVVTPMGLLAAMWALLTPARGSSARGWLAVWAWIAGVFCYALLVFPMVSSAHDYYLLPMLAPAAILIGAFLEELGRGGDWRASVRVTLVIVLLLGSAAVAMKRASYFVHDWQRIETGRLIREHTEPSDLVVSTAKGRSTGGTDPRILYFADRRGWVTSFDRLNRENLDTYRGANARYVALLLTPDFPPADEQYHVLAGFPHRVYDLAGMDGAGAGWLVLFDVAEPQEGDILEN